MLQRRSASLPKDHRLGPAHLRGGKVRRLLAALFSSERTCPFLERSFHSRNVRVAPCSTRYLSSGSDLLNRGGRCGRATISGLDSRTLSDDRIGRRDSEYWKRFPTSE